MNFKKKYQIWIFQKGGKIHNKFLMAKEIGCRNDIILRKIGGGHEISKAEKLLSWMCGWVGEKVGVKAV